MCRATTDKQSCPPCPAAGIETRMFYSVQRDEVYCKIRCPLDRLEREAVSFLRSLVDALSRRIGVNLTASQAVQHICWTGLWHLASEFYTCPVSLLLSKNESKTRSRQVGTLISRSFFSLDLLYHVHSLEDHVVFLRRIRVRVFDLRILTPFIILSGLPGRSVKRYASTDSTTKIAAALPAHS